MDEEPIPGSGASESRRDRLKQLRAFCEAVRAGSLSGAARALDASQAVVSGHVRALEEELGAALFRRAGAGLAPTRIGGHLHHIARPLVEGLERLPELFEEHHTGVAAETLRIGAGEVSGGSGVARARAQIPGALAANPHRGAHRHRRRAPRVASRLRARPRGRRGPPRARRHRLPPARARRRGARHAEGASAQPARECGPSRRFRATGSSRSPPGAMYGGSRTWCSGCTRFGRTWCSRSRSGARCFNHVAAGVGVAIVPNVCVSAARAGVPGGHRAQVPFSHLRGGDAPRRGCLARCAAVRRARGGGRGAVMRRRIQSKRDRVRQLRAFCETVRLGSVTAAAEHLGLTQPAVSLSVRELELELGAELFERGRAGVAVTLAGERLHALAEPLVRGVDAVFRGLRGESRRARGATGARCGEQRGRHLRRPALRRALPRTPSRHRGTPRDNIVAREARAPARRQGGLRAWHPRPPPRGSVRLPRAPCLPPGAHLRARPSARVARAGDPA